MTMLAWQKILILSYGIFAFLGFAYGLYKVVKGKNNIGNAHIFHIIGAFVWADAIIFGIFWSAVSIATYFLNDWILFLLIQSVFWSVRCLGESVYWFNQQFSKPVVPGNEKLFVHKIFRDNYTSWFVMQIIAQCEAVIAIVFSIYFAHLWILGL